MSITKTAAWSLANAAGDLESAKAIYIRTETDMVFRRTTGAVVEHRKAIKAYLEALAKMKRILTRFDSLGEYVVLTEIDRRTEELQNELENLK